MKTFKTAMFSMLVATAFSANAALIDFTAETTGAIANGYAIQDVTFFDTMGANMQINNFGVQSHGNGLAVFGDDASMLRMTFSGVFDTFALDFGNDDYDPNRVSGIGAHIGDLALLTFYLSGSQVGQTQLALNLDDIMNQTIGASNLSFDEVTFAYVNPNLQPISLIEVVDNIVYDRVAPIPEPSSYVLLGLGLLGVMLRRRSIAADKGGVADLSMAS